MANCFTVDEDVVSYNLLNLNNRPKGFMFYLDDIINMLKI